MENVLKKVKLRQVDWMPRVNITIYNVYIYQTVDFIILKVNMVRLTRFDWTARSTRILRLLSYGN